MTDPFSRMHANRLRARAGKRSRAHRVQEKGWGTFLTVGQKLPKLFPAKEMTCWTEGPASLIRCLLQPESNVKYILWPFSFEHTKYSAIPRQSTGLPVADAVCSDAAFQQPAHLIHIVLPLQGSDIAQGVRTTRTDVVNFPTILRLPISKLITFYPSSTVILSPETWLVSGHDLGLFPHPLNDCFTVFHGSALLPWHAYRSIAAR